MLMITVWFLPAIVLAVLGAVSGVWGAGLGLAFVWIGFCIFKGSIVVEQQEFVVIERLGKYLDVRFHGWHVFIPGVDRIHAQGNLRAQRLKLYSNEKAAQIDFKDASAPINASIWYQVGKPEDIANQDWEKVAESVRTWVYNYEKPLERIIGLADGGLRPLLQSKTLDEASGERDKIATEVMAAIGPEMEKFGVYLPSDGKRLIIEDIALPDAVIKLREMALEGKKRAEESTNEATGYWKAIKEIADNLSVSIPDATSIYQTQRGLDTLKEVKPGMTLVGKGLQDVLYTMDLGSKKS